MIPEDLFAGILNEGESLSEIWYYIVREGFTYPPGPPLSKSSPCSIANKHCITT